MDNTEVKSDIPSCLFLQTPLDVLYPGKIKQNFFYKANGERSSSQGVNGQISLAIHLKSERWLKDVTLQQLTTEDTKEKKNNENVEIPLIPSIRNSYFFAFICNTLLRNWSAHITKKWIS